MYTALAGEAGREVKRGGLCRGGGAVDGHSRVEECPEHGEAPTACCYVKRSETLELIGGGEKKRKTRGGEGGELPGNWRVGGEEALESIGRGNKKGKVEGGGG